MHVVELRKLKKHLLAKRLQATGGVARIVPEERGASRLWKRADSSAWNGHACGADRRPTRPAARLLAAAGVEARSFWPSPSSVAISSARAARTPVTRAALLPQQRSCTRVRMNGCL